MRQGMGGSEAACKACILEIGAGSCIGWHLYMFIDVEYTIMHI